MSEAGEQFLEAIVAAVVLILLGTALAPVLPYNIAALGWFLLGMIVLVGGVMAALAIGQMVNQVA